MLHEQANTLDPYNIEAFLLKGTALLELKKVDDATPHMKEALRLAPHRYEAYTGKEPLRLGLHRYKAYTSKEALRLAPDRYKAYTGKDWLHTDTRLTQVKTDPTQIRGLHR